MSSDEDDYLSDKFLSNIPDIKPGLVNKRTTIRENMVEAKRKKIAEEQKAKSSEGRLSQALKTSIPTSNKGFKLLQQMGYKQGGGLGKFSDGIVEPIGIQVKQNRLGLGVETVRRANIEMGPVREVDVDDYKNRVALKREEKDVENALRKIKKSCNNMDIQSGLLEPIASWYWEKVPVEKNTSGSEEDDSEDDENTEELPSSLDQFNEIRDYLRHTYSYCFWCGTKYNDQEDLETNCPGLDKNTH